MEFRRFKDLLAIKSPKGKVWGFHAYNLELAEVTEELWQSLISQQSLAAEPALLSELEAWNSEVAKDTSDAINELKIKKLSLNVAQICNLHCTYCAAGGDGTYGSKVTKLDLNIAQKQIRHFLGLVPSEVQSDLSKTKGINEGDSDKAANEFQIQFLGGEPLLYPSVIRELCQYARLCVAGRNIDVKFSITTNGTLITPKIADMLAEFNFAVAISLDGDKETNDRSRPNKSSRVSSTVLTLRGIHEIQRVREQIRFLKVNSVFGSHNMKIFSTYKYLISLGVDWDEINLLYANNEQDDECTKIYIEEMNQIASWAYENGGLTQLAVIKQFQSVLARLAAKTRLHSYCGAGKSFLQIDTRGELYACNWFMNDESEMVGQGTELRADKMSEYERSFIESNKCESCWARHLCGGGCLAVHKAKSGNKNEKDKNFCLRTRGLAATAIDYYAQSLSDEN